MLNNNPHIYLISDSTGETVSIVARSVYARFENINFNESRWALIRSNKQIDNIIKIIEEKPGMILYTMINKKLEKYLQKKCMKININAHPILDSTIIALKEGFELKTKNEQIPGKQHSLSEDYFDRIEALQYAIANDDGQVMEQSKAEIILFGVSRTSKTPTSMYLAHRGYKVANYALVPKVPFPLHYLDGLNLLVVGLTNDPKRLSQIRHTRQIAMADKDNMTYADIDQITEEIRQARRLFSEQSWPVIDVTRRSIEETAAAVIQLYTNWQESQA